MNTFLESSLRSATLLVIGASLTAQTPTVVSSVSPDGNFVSLGTKALFTVGSDLWSTDGKTAVTKVADLVPGIPDSVGDLTYLPAGATRVGYFTASAPKSKWGLYKSDGTALGTSAVALWEGTPKPVDLRRVGTLLYFAASGTATGQELWKSDGTTTGTVLVKDIAAGAGSSHPSEFTALGTSGKCVFAAWSSATGRELWLTDGSAAGTKLIKDILPGGGSFSSDPRWLTPLGGKVLFIARTSGVDYGLYATDGTEAGTTKLASYIVRTPRPLAPGYLTRAGSLVYLRAHGTADYAGSELYVTDGTVAGTRIVRDLAAGSEVDSAPEHLTAVVRSRLRREVFFTAATPHRGRELWRSDGTAGGTVPCGEIVAGKGGASFTYGRTDGRLQHCLLSDGTLLFGASDGTSTKLWKLDTTVAPDTTGIGCGKSGTRVPSLGASEPRIGKTWEVVLDDGDAGAFRILVLGVEAASPIKLAGSCYSYLDLLSPVFVLDVTKLASRHSVYYLTLPSDPTLTGVELAVQAWVAPTDAAFGFDVTNGVFQKIK